MNLSLLPDRRAAADPLGPAVADDVVELTNAAFLDAVSSTAADLRGVGVDRKSVV